MGRGWKLDTVLFTDPSWLTKGKEKFWNLTSPQGELTEHWVFSCHGKKSSQFRWPLVELNSKAHRAIISIYGAPGMEIGKGPRGSAPEALLGPWQPVPLGWRAYIRAIVTISDSRRRPYLFLYCEQLLHSHLLVLWYPFGSINTPETSSTAVFEKLQVIKFNLHKGGTERRHRILTKYYTSTKSAERKKKKSRITAMTEWILWIPL